VRSTPIRRNRGAGSGTPPDDVHASWRHPRGEAGDDVVGRVGDLLRRLHLTHDDPRSRLRLHRLGSETLAGTGVGGGAPLGAQNEWSLAVRLVVDGLDEIGSAEPRWVARR
jgi:hypothetical protein